MFNSIFITHLGKEPLLLSDSSRHEREQSTPNKLVRFFTYLQGYTSVKKYSRPNAAQHAKPIKYIIKNSLITLTDGELQLHFQSVMNDLLAGKEISSNLNQAFACVGEGVKRVFGFYPHDVQYLGAYILLQGQLAEMQTGEGKTIVAGMAATVVAGAQASVHVLSTNEYLSTRDQEEMSALFDFFSIESGAINSEMEPVQRGQEYVKPICYVSASELVFDVLKDSLHSDNSVSRHQSSLRQFVRSEIGGRADMLVPALHFCIVDEADSVLIDEASTPLIISQETDSIMDESVLMWALNQAKKLEKDVDFKVDFENRDIDLFNHFPQKITSIIEHAKPMWQTYAWQKIILKKALTAIHLFNVDEHYIILDDKIVIVDESTGRPMPDRSWEQGLHQLIELKEGLEVSKTRETIAQITFQAFFRKYLLLSGLTGTAKEVSRELWNVYGLGVCIVPPNKKNLRHRYPRVCFTQEVEKWQAVAQETLKLARSGQPVLIGTRSVEASEKVMNLLKIENSELTMHLLNARQDADESAIIAQSGKASTITVATNIAGRGTDIKLDDRAKRHGGLCVILTEHHDSRRIDRQLIGRSARQGDVGAFREMVCFEDAIFQSNKSIFSVLGRYVGVYKLRNVFYAIAVSIAQKRAQDRQYEMRMNTLKQDRKRQQQIGFIGKLK